jgi:hypothetical protein
MVTLLDGKLIPPLERIGDFLDDYDPVTQQKLIELVTTRHAARAGKEATFIANSVHKHVLQLLKQLGHDQ